ncbi:putative oligoendopeptidase F [Tetragenococcus muriaticus 3MR10-3]|uniref:Putative oligoendopeptidase F n=1 Tax=Tetragenococcus muriaticus 3MR10-3 TaxID=1302648 RepID=A0A091CBQ7_9ENTE|nr:putative oligoendopeptidase F [Tetragenococcus muriaticus 3MR10-3]
MNYSLTWDLNTIFPGGSHSKELQQRMATLDEQITELHQAVQSFEAEKRITTNLLTILNWNAKVSNGFEECGSFIEALLSADVSDTKAKLLSGELSKKTT